MIAPVYRLSKLKKLQRIFSLLHQLLCCEFRHWNILSVSLSVGRSVGLSVFASISQSLSVCLSVCLPVSVSQSLRPPPPPPSSFLSLCLWICARLCVCVSARTHTTHAHTHSHKPARMHVYFCLSLFLSLSACACMFLYSCKQNQYEVLCSILYTPFCDDNYEVSITSWFNAIIVFISWQSRKYVLYSCVACSFIYIQMLAILKIGNYPFQMLRLICFSFLPLVIVCLLVA